MMTPINCFFYTLMIVTVVLTSFTSCNNEKPTYPQAVVRNNLIPQYKRATLALLIP